MAKLTTIFLMAVIMLAACSAANARSIGHVREGEQRDQLQYRDMEDCRREGDVHEERCGRCHEGNFFDEGCHRYIKRDSRDEECRRSRDREEAHERSRRRYLDFDQERRDHRHKGKSDEERRACRRKGSPDSKGVTPRIVENLSKMSVVAVVLKRPMNNLVMVMQNSTKRGVTIVMRGILIKRGVNVVVTK